MPRAGGGHDVLAATSGGVVLVSGDGQLRAVWTALDGLPGTRADALLRDGDGDTWWIGSEAGLARVRIDGARMDVVAAYPSKPVRAVTRHDGQVYAATWGGGVMRLGAGGLEPVPEAGDSAGSKAARVTALAVKNGVLVAATAAAGIYELHAHRLRPWDVQGRDLARAPIWSLAVRGDSVWAGTMSGLYQIKDNTVVQFGNDDVRQVRVDAQGVVVATFGRGVRRLRGSSFVPVSPMPAEAQYLYAAGDANGAACLATHHGLWSKPSAASPWQKARLGGLPSSDIAALAGDGERLWAGTFDQGLAVYEEGRWRPVRDPAIDPKINALAVSEGRLWVATSNGLNIVDGDRVMRMDTRDGLPSRHVMSITPLKGGGVLAGTAQGAAILRDGEITVLGRKQGISIGNVWAVAEDPSGALWLGTTKGLYRVASSGASWQRFSVATGHLRDDWVMALAISGDALWAGTYKGGATRFARRSDGSVVATQVGSAHSGDDWINPGGLTWHQGTLYAATMNGLLQGDGTTWHKRERAAPGIDTTAVAVHEAHLWIASRRGLRAITTAP
jgi:ligand-binding sensor domain-containing protein